MAKKGEDVARLSSGIIYGGMIASTIIFSFFRPLVVLAILDAAPFLYPIVNAFIGIGFLAPFAIFYGICLDPMTTILSFLYNWIDGEFDFRKNMTDFWMMLLRVVGQSAISWVAGTVYRAFRNGVPLPAGFAPNNVSPLLDAPVVFMIGFLAFVFYIFYMLCAMWIRDSYGVYAIMTFAYMGVSYAGFVLYADVIDFGMTLAVSAATGVYTVNILWVFIAEIVAVIIVAILYNFIFYPMANHWSAAADNRGDAKFSETMINMADPEPAAQPAAPAGWVCGPASKAPLSDARIAAIVRHNRTMRSAGKKGRRDVEIGGRNGGFGAL